MLTNLMGIFKPDSNDDDAADKVTTETLQKCETAGMAVPKPSTDNETLEKVAAEPNSPNSDSGFSSYASMEAAIITNELSMLPISSHRKEQTPDNFISSPTQQQSLQDETSDWNEIERKFDGSPFEPTLEKSNDATSPSFLPPLLLLGLESYISPLQQGERATASSSEKKEKVLLSEALHELKVRQLVEQDLMQDFPSTLTKKILSLEREQKEETSSGPLSAINVNENGESEEEEEEKGHQQEPHTSSGGGVPTAVVGVQEAHVACPTCDRTFNPVSLSRHVRVCQQVFGSQRTPFNSAQKRLAHFHKEQSKRGVAKDQGAIATHSDALQARYEKSCEEDRRNAVPRSDVFDPVDEQTRAAVRKVMARNHQLECEERVKAIADGHEDRARLLYGTAPHDGSGFFPHNVMESWEDEISSQSHFLINGSCRPTSAASAAVRRQNDEGQRVLSNAKEYLHLQDLRRQQEALKEEEEVELKMEWQKALQRETAERLSARMMRIYERENNCPPKCNVGNERKDSQNREYYNEPKYYQQSTYSTYRPYNSTNRDAERRDAYVGTHPSQKERDWKVSAYDWEYDFDREEDHCRNYTEVAHLLGLTERYKKRVEERDELRRRAESVKEREKVVQQQEKIVSSFHQDCESYVAWWERCAPLKEGEETAPTEKCKVVKHPIMGGGRGGVKTPPSCEPKNTTQSTTPPTSSKWREQSATFQEAMQAAKNYKLCLQKGSPLPPHIASQPGPALIPCPHCTRRFHDKAAQRHIPLCASITHRPGPTLRKGEGHMASAFHLTTKDYARIIAHSHELRLARMAAFAKHASPSPVRCNAKRPSRAQPCLSRTPPASPFKGNGEKDETKLQARWKTQHAFTPCGHCARKFWFRLLEGHELICSALRMSRPTALKRGGGAQMWTYRPPTPVVVQLTDKWEQNGKKAMKMVVSAVKGGGEKKNTWRFQSAMFRTLYALKQHTKEDKKSGVAAGNTVTVPSLYDPPCTVVFPFPHYHLRLLAIEKAHSATVMAGTVLTAKHTWK